MNFGKMTLFLVATLLMQPVLAQRGATPESIYRDDQAVVITPSPPPEPPPSGISPDKLRSALVAAGNPRFILMWNKRLTDRIDTEYVPTENAARVTEITKLSKKTVVVTESYKGTRAMREGEQSALAQGDDWEVRGGFEGWLISAGMNLVDRVSALRQAGLNVNQDEPNLQKLEMEALKSYADYMLEVLSTPAEGPAGAKFRVRVTNLKSGRTVVSLSSTGALPVVTTTRYEGYQQVTDVSSTSIEEVGARIAQELGERLTSVIRNRP